MTYGLEVPILLVYPSVDRAKVSYDSYPKTKDSLRRFCLYNKAIQFFKHIARNGYICFAGAIVSATAL